MVRKRSFYDFYDLEEDNDVICIDDDDDDEDIVNLYKHPRLNHNLARENNHHHKSSMKRRPWRKPLLPPNRHCNPKCCRYQHKLLMMNDGSSSGESDDAGAVEVVELLNEVTVNAKPAFGTLGWLCSICKERSDDFQSHLDDLALAAFGAADVVETKQSVWPPHINETAV